MLASAKDNSGRVGVVIDNGCLFRGGKEKAIRSAVINNDLIEAVILLPEKLFYNTGAPGAIILFNKNKSAGRKRKILFINASSERLRKTTKGQIALTERQMKIVERIIQSDRVSIGDVSEMFKITRQAALKEMNKLTEQRVIKLIGKGRGAYYSPCLRQVVI